MPKETILVIDSDTETAQQMVMTLEEEDYLVFTAPSGSMGVAMAKKVTPSLIFFSPASGGGLDVCREIHEIGSLKDVPIIVLSSFGGASDPRYASEYGIVDALERSFTDDELLSKTRKALSLRNQEVRSGGEDEPGEGGRGLIVEEQGKPRERDTDREAVSVPRAAEEEEVFSGAGEPGEQEEGRGIRDFSYPGSTSEAAKPFQEKRRGRGRRRSTGPSLASVAVLAVLVLVAAGAILSYHTIVSWMGKSQAPASSPVVARKAAVEPTPTVSPTPQPKAEAKESGAPAREEKPSAAGPTPPVQTTVAKTAPKTDRGGSDEPKYSVQIGAFKSGNNADSLAGQYKEKGYDAFVLKGVKNGETFYRVLIGRFEDLRKASAMAANVNAKEHLKVTVFRGQEKP